MVLTENDVQITTKIKVGTNFFWCVQNSKLIYKGNNVHN